MGRGGSQAVAADFNLIASRGFDARGTELGELDAFELDDQEWVALKALVSLSYENPDAPGFEDIVVRNFAAGFAGQADEGWNQNLPKDKHRDTSFSYDETARIVSGLEQKGLVERTTSYLDIDTGKLHEGEQGWIVKPAGTQMAGAIMNGILPA